MPFMIHASIDSFVAISDNLSNQISLFVQSVNILGLVHLF